MQNTEPQLSSFQKQSIAMIYYLTSQSYLEMLLTKLEELIKYTGGVLELADQQYRDRALVQQGWNMGDTSANWSTYGYPSLLDFRLGLIKIIEQIKSNNYHYTPAYNTAKMLEEFQPNWMTKEEESEFKTRFDDLYRLCSYYDFCVKSPRSWDLFNLFEAMSDLGFIASKVPKLKIRTDIRGNSGECPPKTGVYIPIGDIYGAPQFAWTYKDNENTKQNGYLEKCKTVNNLGLELFSEFNEYTAWKPSIEIRKFLIDKIKEKKIEDDWSFMEESIEVQLELGPSLLSRNTFKEFDCSWYFVELIDNEFEVLEEKNQNIFTTEALKIKSGELCSRTGYWVLSSNKSKRLYFTKGTVLSQFNKDWGDEYWIFDGEE